MAGALVAPAAATADIGPLVDAGRAVDRHVNREMDSVIMDNRRAARDATAVLQRRGYRRIACITGSNDVETARHRAEGWLDAVGEVPSAAERLLAHEDFRLDSGREAMVRLLDSAEPPDAVLVLVEAEVPTISPRDDPGATHPTERREASRSAQGTLSTAIRDTIWS